MVRKGGLLHKKLIIQSLLQKNGARDEKSSQRIYAAHQILNLNDGQLGEKRGGWFGCELAIMKYRMSGP